MTSAGLAELYVAESGRLRRLVRRIVGSAEAAEDVVHDTFLKLGGRAVGPEDVGLLVRTAQNAARDARRAARVRAAYVEQVTPEQLGAGAPAPDAAAAGRRELADLMAALETLPERTRRVFLMSKLDEMAYPQIARALDVSLSTVEKEMVSALAFCRAWRLQRS